MLTREVTCALAKKCKDNTIQIHIQYKKQEAQKKRRDQWESRVTGKWSTFRIRSVFHVNRIDGTERVVVICANVTSVRLVDLNLTSRSHVMEPLLTVNIRLWCYPRSSVNCSSLLKVTPSSPPKHSRVKQQKKTLFWLFKLTHCTIKVIVSSVSQLYGSALAMPVVPVAVIRLTNQYKHLTLLT